MNKMSTKVLLIIILAVVVLGGALFPLTGLSHSVYAGAHSSALGEVQGNAYQPSSSGTFTVNGGPLSQTIAFNPVTYNVTFTESGLPLGAGEVWNVTLNSVEESSPLSSIKFSESNGTYSYTVGIYQGYSSSPYSSTVTVNGTSVSVSVTFTQVKYSVTFTESGLQSGNWYVNITGQPSSAPIPSSQTSYSTSLPNGSYSYTVSTNNSAYKPSYPGTFTINGTSVSQTITFAEVKYTVTFTESGLPTSTPWYVNITGQPSSGKITSSSWSISLPNGTYSYTVSTGNKEYAALPAEHILNGPRAYFAIVFAPVTHPIPHPFPWWIILLIALLAAVIIIIVWYKRR